MQEGIDKLKEELRALEKRIAGAAGTSAPEDQTDSSSPPSSKGGSDKDDGTSLALRVPAELLAGIGVGYFIGDFLDNLLETRPFFTMMCLLLGMAGAVFNIYKALR